MKNNTKDDRNIIGPRCISSFSDAENSHFLKPISHAYLSTIIFLEIGVA